MHPAKLLAIILALAIPAFPGDVTGRVLITKRLTKRTVSQAIYDLRGAAPPTARADAGLASEFERTVVILEGKLRTPNPPVTITIKQLDTSFDPDLVVVPVHSTVQFPNLDPIFHSVFSLSSTRSFDLGFYPKGQSRQVRFDRPGVVQVYCHIHSNMYGAIVVTDSRWYARPSEEGAFSWRNVTAGHYRLVAWHKIAGFFRTEIEVPENGTAAVTISVPVSENAPQ
jgi:plastocyanin